MDFLTKLDVYPHRTGLIGSVLLASVLIASAFVSPWAPLVVAGILLSCIALIYVLSVPTWNISLILVGFFLVADYQDGIQLREPLYILLYLNFILLWFLSRLFLSPHIFIKTALDKAISFYLLFVTIVGFTLMFVNDGVLLLALNEWISLTMFFLYFPIKEACKLGKRETFIIVGSFFVLVLLIITRNLLKYQSFLENTEMMWQVLRGRINLNEVLLMFGSVLSISLLLFERTKLIRVLYMIVAGLGVLGLLLGRSRSYWVVLVLAMGLLLIFVPTKQRIYLLQYGFLGFFLAFAFLFLLLQGSTWILLQTILVRFVSIDQALSQDISFVNRIVEAKGVLAAILSHPLLGYGLGSNYQVWDAIEKTTYIKNYSHNGFLTVALKTGFIGLFTLLTVLGLGILKGISLFRYKFLPSYRLALGYSSLAVLIAMLPAGFAASPFLEADTSLAYTLALALIASSSEVVRENFQALPSLSPRTNE